MPRIASSPGADRVEVGHEWLDAAEEIVDRGLWCVVEVCVDIACQQWEPTAVICRAQRSGIASAVEDVVADQPGHDARIAGYTLDGLRRSSDAPVALCHLAAA